ncbi:MAG: N-6 DNA methylase [Turicibacter sp.]|nr:N-6 DNA methylase [Turicibacter sp.]
MLKTYHSATQSAHANGNDESLYIKPISDLLAGFAIIAEDYSTSRAAAMGENVDIKLWQADEDSTITPPFAAIEVKAIGKIDSRAITQAENAAKIYRNAILTDNLEWQFWRISKNGSPEMYEKIQIMTLTNGEVLLNTQNIPRFNLVLEDFALQPPANVPNSNKLAFYMARYSKNIRRIAAEILTADSHPQRTALLALLDYIKTKLLPNLEIAEFSDIYAQTIVYSIFIARYNNPTASPFDRRTAKTALQNESPLLREFFRHITESYDIDTSLNRVIDNLCKLFQNCDISTIITVDKDGYEIIHFYEDFLSQYDERLRREKGVFYTPPEVVQFMVNLVDERLVADFNIKKGLADNAAKGNLPHVAILDPSCGTGAFLAEIIKFAKQKYYATSPHFNECIFDKIEADGSHKMGLLSRMIGFEIMMTSYVVAHLNIRRTIDIALATTTNINASVYLTNTLTEVRTIEQIDLWSPLGKAIAEESINAQAWKAHNPVKVIISNPPYNVRTNNTLMKDDKKAIDAYKFETDGKTRLNERPLNSLNDDYVQFFRFAEQVVQRNGDGVLAYVSNNGFLDNPTFRGMRASLLRTFDKIYIVNMHGNANKRELTPDGTPDENIFDIRVGISLFIGIKTGEVKNDTWADVFYADVWGRRAEKLAKLKDVQFQQLKIDKQMAYFIPFGNGTLDIYRSGVSVANLFPIYNSGTETGNDKVAIAFTKPEIEHRLDIVKNATDEQAIKNLFGKYSYSQTAQKIQTDVFSDTGKVVKIAFRPFDDRYTFYSGRSGGWLHTSSNRTMQHLLKDSKTPIGKNIAMVFARRDTSQDEFAMVFVTDKLSYKFLLTTRSSGNAFIAPLYLYDENTADWQPNINPQERAKLTANLKKANPSPLEIFDYCYGVLHSPKYRAKYSEYLKRDFPRVPIPANIKEFTKYAKAGEQLRRLHLLDDSEPLALSLSPNTAEDLQITKIAYENGILHINDNKQIVGIPPEIWEYRIGGYQVLEKWLKSRENFVMGEDNMEFLAKMAGALSATLAIQRGL